MVHGLQEVLANEENKIDHAFKLSMSIDIAAVSKHQAKWSNKNLMWLNGWTVFDQTSHKESLRFREKVLGLPVLDEPGFLPAPRGFVIGWVWRPWERMAKWLEFILVSLILPYLSSKLGKAESQRGERRNVPHLVFLNLHARLPRRVIRLFFQPRSLVPG